MQFPYFSNTYIKLKPATGAYMQRLARTLYKQTQPAKSIDINIKKTRWIIIDLYIHRNLQRYCLNICNIVNLSSCMVNNSFLYIPRLTGFLKICFEYSLSFQKDLKSFSRFCFRQYILGTIPSTIYTGVTRELNKYVTCHWTKQCKPSTVFVIVYLFITMYILQWYMYNKYKLND